MTNEEAKMQIQAIPGKIWDQLSEPDREAMEMAFSALEKQDVPDTNVGDTISRQAAIDAIEKNAYRHTYLDQIIDIVSEVPSAQPEIVRCKDCIFHGFCRASTRWAVAPKDDWYCADGKRRTDEGD